MQVVGENAEPLPGAVGGVSFGWHRVKGEPGPSKCPPCGQAVVLSQTFLTANDGHCERPPVLDAGTVPTCGAIKVALPVPGAEALRPHRPVRSPTGAGRLWSLLTGSVRSSEFVPAWVRTGRSHRGENRGRALSPLACSLAPESPLGGGSLRCARPPLRPLNLATAAHRSAAGMTDQA